MFTVFPYQSMLSMFIYQSCPPWHLQSHSSDPCAACHHWAPQECPRNSGIPVLAPEGCGAQRLDVALLGSTKALVYWLLLSQVVWGRKSAVGHRGKWVAPNQDIYIYVDIYIYIWIYIYGYIYMVIYIYILATGCEVQSWLEMGISSQITSRA